MSLSVKQSVVNIC